MDWLIALLILNFITILNTAKAMLLALALSRMSHHPTPQLH
jgi:hypothetical protein